MNFVGGICIVINSIVLRSFSFGNCRGCNCRTCEQTRSDGSLSMIEKKKIFLKVSNI